MVYHFHPLDAPAVAVAGGSPQLLPSRKAVTAIMCKPQVLWVLRRGEIA